LEVRVEEQLKDWSRKIAKLEAMNAELLAALKTARNNLNPRYWAECDIAIEKAEGNLHSRKLNAELLAFIKEQLENSKSETDHNGVSTFDEARAEELIAKAEGKCAN
jgi:hypothetical protein